MSIVNDVVRAELDSDEPFIIPVHPNRTLTISFPNEIDGVWGKGFTRDPQQVAGDYLLDYVDGDRFLGISMLANQGQAAMATPPWNLNVVMKGNVYVLKPVPVAEISSAWTSLTFLNPKPLPKVQQTTEQVSRGVVVEHSKKKKDAGVTKSAFSPDAPQKRVSATRMLGMVDTLKMLGQLEPQMIGRTLRAMPHLDYASPTQPARDFGFASVRVMQVLRYDEIDALAFDVLITNKLPDPLYLNVENAGVRVGEYVYRQTLSDMPAVIPANGASRGYFVIVGDGQGGRNLMSVDNEFYPIISLQGGSGG